MDEKELKILGKDKDYWWFKAKDELIKKEIFENLKTSAKILNVGPGVFPLHYAENYYGDVCKLPYEDEFFDIVIMADVLEHIYNREDALYHIRRVLKNGGKLILTVPAHQWLYNKHDIFLEHFLRYGKKQLKDEIEYNGFETIKLRYWNSILFPLLVLWKLFLSKNESDFRKLPKFLNWILYKILKTEEIVTLPWGISLFGVFQKNDV
ncbi:hypothetical protein DRN69_08010 [Candidatus Pacearchaeota archaeon]|nr:MAG: hypothetical protein DRN69_08010 [Candidatus Pacearchaeota archaeon]